MDELSYYDSQLEYQKKVGEIEKERLRLEREMFSMLRTDKKLQNLKAAKLRSYWQQVCEREKRARERNEEILRDFENMEVKLSALETQTQRLRNMKMQYDEKVKQMYPKWRKEVEMARAKKQLLERGIKMSPRKENIDPVVSPTYKDMEGNTRPSRGKRQSPRYETPIQGQLVQLPSKHPSPTHQQEKTSPTYENTQPTSKSTSRISVSEKPLSTTSEKSNTDLESRASMQPPPESFADATPQKVIYVNTTAPTKSASFGHNVIHTIPTALSSTGGQTDISETSLASDDPNGLSKLGSISEVGLPQATQTSSTSKPLSDGRRSYTSIGSDFVSPTRSKKGGSSAHSKSKESINTQNTQSPNKTESIISKSPSHVSWQASPVKGQTQGMSSLSAMSSPGKMTATQESKVERNLSFSGSDDLSPRQTAPLTESAAYQAMLKQHTKPTALSMSHQEEDSDEDDMENLLSPHGHPPGDHGFSDSNMKDDSDGDTFSDGPKSPRVYIPTAMSARSSNEVKKQAMETRSKPAKEPWNTDSEEDDFLATGGSHFQNEPDDFDFYD